LVARGKAEEDSSIHDEAGKGKIGMVNENEPLIKRRHHRCRKGTIAYIL